MLSTGLLLLVLVGCSYAYPSGAPSNICGRYVPGGHRNRNTPLGNPPQGPYALDVQPISGGSYKVTLRGTQGIPFKGFVIQAMQANPAWKRFPGGAEDIVGTFQPNQDMTSFMPQPSQLRRCTGMAGSNVITHSDSNPKLTVDVTWTPPRMASDPSYKLVATVVRDYDTFYVVQSDAVNAQAGSSSQLSQGTSGGLETTGLSSQSVDNTVISPTGSPSESSFLSPSQGSFTFPGVDSGMRSQVGMDGGDPNSITGIGSVPDTLTDSSTNLAVPPSSVFFTGQSSGFSSPNSGFNSMDGINGVPGANLLPVIPNNVHFTQNFPTTADQSSEISIPTRNGSFESNNLRALLFPSSDTNAAGIQQPNITSAFKDDLHFQSSSVMFQGQNEGLPSRIDVNNKTESNISAELSANPPLALEIVEVSTMAPERIPDSLIEFQPPTTASPIEGSSTFLPFEPFSTMKSFISTNTSNSSKSSSTLKPFQQETTLDSFLLLSTENIIQASSSLEPFLSSSTADTIQASSTLEPFLPYSTSKSSNHQSTIKSFQPASTADSIVPPTTITSFQPPTTSIPFIAIDPFQETSTVIPFQAPTKPKSIEIPFTAGPSIASTATQTAQESSTSRPFLPAETFKPFEPPTEALSTEKSSGPQTTSFNFQSQSTFKPVQPSKTILFEPPATSVPLEPLATYDPLAPPPPIFLPDNFPPPVPIAMTNKSVTDSVTVPVTRPIASIDLPIRIDSPTSNTMPTGDVRVVLRTSSPSETTGTFVPDIPSSSSSTFEVVSTVLTDVMRSSDPMTSSNDISSPKSLEGTALRVEPIVNVINVPVPSGRIAAVLNFTRNDRSILPTDISTLRAGAGRFVTIGRPLGGFQGQGQVGAQPGRFGATMFGQQSAGQFSQGQFRGPGTFGGRTTFPIRPFQASGGFAGQGQRFPPGQFGGSVGGQTAGTSDTGAGAFGFQQFANPMPSGFVGQSTQFGGQGSAGMQFPGQGPTFVSQGAVRQFRFGPQGSQMQTFRFQPQPGQFTTFRFGSQPGQFSGTGFMASGPSQGQVQGQTGQTFGQTGGAGSFLTPVGV